MKYYLLDLSYCPERFDSWAGLSLAKSRKIIDKIQQVRLSLLAHYIVMCMWQCDIKSGTEKFVQKHACGALRYAVLMVVTDTLSCVLYHVAKVFWESC